MDFALLSLAGLLAGFLNGLFALGGALTVVPILIYTLPFLGVSKNIFVHIAVGTSLAVMLFNNLNALRKHQSNAYVEWSLFRKFAPFIFIGALLGAFLTFHLPSVFVLGIFLCFLFAIILKFFLYPRKSNPIIINDIHRSKVITMISTPANISYTVLSGILASSVGGGCGLIMVPYLKQMGFPMKKATATTVSFNIVIACVAVVSYSILGNHTGAVLPKYATGFIYWPAFFFIVLGALFGVPIGTYTAKRLPERLFYRFYAILLIAVFIIILIKLYLLCYNQI